MENFQKKMMPKEFPTTNNMYKFNILCVCEKMDKQTF